MKYLKYLLTAAVILFLGYHSVYFSKLSETKKRQTGRFDAVAYVSALWKEKLEARLDSALSFPQLVNAINNDPETAFEKYTNTLAIGNYRYAFVTFRGVVKSTDADELIIDMPSADTLMSLHIATEFVYGNAIRDASGLVEVKDFPNTTDLNKISEEMNRRIREQVLPSVKKEIRPGDGITGTGAIQVNKAHISWRDPEIIPVRIQKMN